MKSHSSAVLSSHRLRNATLDALHRYISNLFTIVQALRRKRNRESYFAILLCMNQIIIEQNKKQQMIVFLFRTQQNKTRNNLLEIRSVVVRNDTIGVERRMRREIVQLDVLNVGDRLHRRDFVAPAHIF